MVGREVQVIKRENEEFFEYQLTLKQYLHDINCYHRLDIRYFGSPYAINVRALKAKTKLISDLLICSIDNLNYFNLMSPHSDSFILYFLSITFNFIFACILHTSSHF